MRVLHITPSVGPSRGGTSEAILGMVSALNNQGISADIATTDDNGEERLRVPHGKRIEFQEAPTYFFPGFSPSHALVRDYAFSTVFTRWLWKNINNYDLIHIHSLFSYPATLSMWLARSRGIPYVNHPHGMLCDWSLQQSSQKKKSYLKLFEYANLNRSKALILTSNQEAKELNRSAFKCCCVIVPIGLTIPARITNSRLRLRQKLGLPATEPIILFLSRIHYKKGLDYLIRALGKVNNHRFSLVIAGSGEPEYERTIKALVQELGLASQTHFVGFVKGDDKDLLLQGSDIFVLTSYSENFGVAVLEALAAGLPAIVTPGVALAEVVKHHQLGVVPELEEGAIATAILQALTQPETMQEMGDRARQFVLNHYTWDRVAVQLMEVYTSILENRYANNSPS
jgi:glycosyltransferase involved in cell wall biosynthesis